MFNAAFRLLVCMCSVQSILFYRYILHSVILCYYYNMYAASSPVNDNRNFPTRAPVLLSKNNVHPDNSSGPQ